MVEYTFDHLHFRCSDVEATAKFMVEMFGGEETFRSEFAQALMVGLRVGGQTLILSGAGPDDNIEGDMSQRRYGLDHWSLWVKDLDACYEELKAKGVQFTRPPTPYGSVRFAFALTPDHVQIELIERK